jgi:hypothetical protein
MMIRTVECDRFQLRYSWRGFALFFGPTKCRTFKLYWRKPAVIFGHVCAPTVIGKWC